MTPTNHPDHVFVHESGDLDELDTHRVPEAEVSRAPGRWATNLLIVGAGYLSNPAQGWPERPGLSQVKLWNTPAPSGAAGTILVCASYDDAAEGKGWPIAAGMADTLDTEATGWIVMALPATTAAVTVRYSWFVPTTDHPIEHRTRRELHTLIKGFIE